jgi:hypothetical protein
MHCLVYDHLRDSAILAQQLVIAGVGGVVFGRRIDMQDDNLRRLDSREMLGVQDLALHDRRSVRRQQDSLEHHRPPW